MSKHCAIQEFLDQNVNLVVSLHTHRYGGGSLPIVVMWSVFTINSMVGLYKWYLVKDGK